MLLPERAFAIKRTDSGYVMPGPAMLPDLCPPLGCQSRIHTPTLDMGTNNQSADRRTSNSHAAAGALRLEPEYAAKSPVHLVHEGCRRVADRFLKVCLVEGDEGGDVDD